MNISGTQLPPGPDQLFVIACPICRGHVAATGRLCGHGACCPLCANLFRVPSPAPETAPAESPLSGDWGAVIEQLAPQARSVPAAPAEEPAPVPDFTFAAEMIAPAAQPAPSEPETPAAAMPGGTSGPDTGPGGADETPQPFAGEPAAPEPAGGAEAPGREEIPDPFPTLAAGAAAPAPVVDTTGFPRTEPAALDPNASELVFHEPVRTIRQQGAVVELRRLTPEERQRRRFRRNLMMIVVGVSILMLIVLLFGVPKQ